MSVRGKTGQPARNGEQGVTLVIIAAFLVFLVGMAVLAIDIGSLYAARSDAQKAADAAALAGAKVFVDSGFTSGVVSQSSMETLARSRAIAVGAQNYVAGQAAAITNADVTFQYDANVPPRNPRITVAVQRNASRGNALPVFFAPIFGVTRAAVGATATAEAFNPSGSGTPVGLSCVKPWIYPNCDYTHTTPLNSNCPGGPAAMFVDASGNIANPGPYTAGGTIGTVLTLKQRNPAQAAAPSQYYPIDLPAGSTPPACPSCGSGGGGGGALYRDNIACCSTNTFVCGQQVTVSTQTGNLVGPTSQGTNCLIHANSDGLNEGQDIFTFIANGDPPITITGGANNPNPACVGQTITSSDSVVTTPLYDGTDLCPGGSCGGTATIVGFLQLGIMDNSAGTNGGVQAIIMNVVGCGNTGGGPPIVAAPGATIPIRLVHN
jgi:hypothetical protein